MFYLCFLAGGSVLPIISFVLGALDGGMDTDIHTDVHTGTDLDLHSDISTGSDINFHSDVNAGADIDSAFSLGLIPTSLMSLSALAITFGTVGGIMSYKRNGTVITFVAAMIAGYLAAVIVQTIVKSLKKVQKRNYGTGEYELLLYDGKIVDTILPGKLGSVSFLTLKNERISYPAKCVNENMKLATGKIVKAIEIKNGIFIVEAKNKYE